jgi:hypothetical protein
MTPDLILHQFDDVAKDIVFPMLDNGYIYPVAVRLSIFRDAKRWLMIIETLGVYAPSLTGCDVFQNCLHLVGGELSREPRTTNEDVEFLYPIDSLPDDPLFDDEYDWFVRPEAEALSIRGHRIALDLSAKALAMKGLQLLEPPKVDPVVVMRSLLPEQRTLLLASSEELATRNSDDLPLFMRLDEWFHPDLAAGELPSACETFQMLAEAISTGEPEAYKPSRDPNTHWRNWPNGGTL